MSKTEEYLKLSDSFWEVEAFNMWYPYHPITIAYIIEKMYDDPQHEALYDRWIELAKKGEYNELAWSIMNTAYSFYSKDPAVLDFHKEYVREKINKYEEKYKNGYLTMFGFVSEPYAPEWFWKLYEAEVHLKELERENTIIEYCMKDLSMSYEESKKVYDYIDKKSFHLINELFFYAKHKRFKKIRPRRVDGKTAEEISKEKGLSALDSYLYLIKLSEEE